MIFENIRVISTTVLYMVASILFIRGIKLLGKADTARKGNLLSSVGMLIAVVTVLFEKNVTDTLTQPPLGNAYLWAAAAIALGAVIGAIWAKKVEMTGMPQLVALFNGFGGLSSLLVALTQYMTDKSINPFSSIALGLTIAIGAIAFTGSIVAWGKLSGKLFKKNVSIPGKNFINGLLAVVGLCGVVMYALQISGVVDSEIGKIGVIIVTAAYLILGFTMVAAIGGGDMPVIISLLNAFSGLAAAFAGLSISNSVLVVSGCLVGTSGLILTLIMCKAMNRTLYSLLFGSFGASSKKGASGEAKEPKSMSVEDAYLILEAASSVVFIPGYGMAVAQAQHAVKELCDKLEENGAEVNFAIHPVAGRMPGHMNVLLAEANVPYEQLAVWYAYHQCV